MPYRTNHITDPLSIQILDSRSLLIDRGWDAEDVCSSFWRLYVNKRDGASLVLRDGSAFRLAANRVYLVPAWVHFSCQNTTGLEHFFVHFDLDGLPGIFIRKLFSTPIELDSSAMLLSVCRSAMSMVHQIKIDSIVVGSRIHALLQLAVSLAWEGLAPQQQASCHEFIHKTHQFAGVLAYIDKHLGQPIHNDDLARECHLSRDHFVRSFGKQLGQSPAQFIRERRIARAAQMLRFDSSNIETIAEQCGFADRFHFSRVFTHIMGSPPAAYRQGNRV
ncbi:MAG TPA: hypothetical protein DCM28_02605 [Phycisphaerales bacterium]|nr:hypothetical protein [Phycisphaerales bacterium]HCD32223.1 hypothetical protein [Phycisphaerales bacterium]|tara:strand:+ start:1117 stop:1944 length:828 start_codon:yes stop_codon:yes gene_type:complete